MEDSEEVVRVPQKTDWKNYLFFLLYDGVKFVVGYIFAAWLIWLRRWLTVRMFAGIAVMDAEDTWTRFGLSIPVYAIIMGVAYVVLHRIKEKYEAWALWKALIINSFVLSFDLSWATFASGPMMEWLSSIRYGIPESDPGTLPYLFVSQLIITTVVAMCAWVAVTLGYADVKRRVKNPTEIPTQLMAPLNGGSGKDAQELVKASEARRRAIKSTIDNGFNFVSGFVWGNFLSFTVLGWVVTEWYRKSTTSAWSVSSRKLFANFESCMYISLVLVFARYWCPHSADRKVEELLAKKNPSISKVRRTRVVQMIRFGFGFSFSFMWAVWNVFGATTGLSRVMFNEQTGTYTCNGTTSALVDVFPSDYAGETFSGALVVSVALLVVYGLVSMTSKPYFPPTIIGDWDTSSAPQAYGLLHYAFAFTWDFSWAFWIVFHLLVTMINWFPNKTACMVVENTGHRLVTMLVLVLIYAVPYRLCVAFVSDDGKGIFTQQWWYDSFVSFVKKRESDVNALIDGVARPESWNPLDHAVSMHVLTPQG